jgi:riboflavin synthase alpha subunit
MLVYFTQSKVIVPGKAVGETVNLEADVLGKYVENSIGALLTRVEALENKLKALGGDGP